MVCFLKNIVVRICSAVLSFPHADCQNSRTRSISSTGMFVSMENRYSSAKTSGVKCGNWTKDPMTTMDTTLILDMSHAQNSEV